MHAPDLGSYDVILVNSSAGKDSQAMLDYIVELAGAALRDRIVVVHCDLGRVEWQGTRELAEAQARYYGVRFEVVKRAHQMREFGAIPGRLSSGVLATIDRRAGGRSWHVYHVQS